MPKILTTSPSTNIREMSLDRRLESNSSSDRFRACSFSSSSSSSFELSSPDDSSASESSLLHKSNVYIPYSIQYFSQWYDCNWTKICNRSLDRDDDLCKVLLNRDGDLVMYYWIETAISKRSLDRNGDLHNKSQDRDD